MSEIRLENIVKTYNNGQVVALDSLSIECHNHEFISILGPSGAGKTTTLKLIAGIEYPDNGKVFIDGIDVTDLPPQKRNVSMVFEGYALYPHLTVRENLEFPLKAPIRSKAYSKSDVKEIAENWAKKVGLGDLLERKVDQLSGGQKQRVSLARALVRDATPAVILMDEPIAHLDAKLRVDMRTELKKLQQDLGATIIYVTHDYTEAMALSDRIIVINEGHLLQVGTPIEIYERPATEFVASVVGEPPMNFFSGSVISNAEGTVFEMNSQTLTFPKIDIPDGNYDLGIRPSEFIISKKADELSFSGIVQAILPTGAKQIMEINVAGKRVLVKTYRDFSYTVGEQVSLKPLTGKAYLFDYVTKERIVVGKGGNLNG